MSRDHLSFPSGEDWCAAYLYRPTASARGVPCVVMAPGFSGTRDDGLCDTAQRFADSGIAALVFDYRHFGRSTGVPRQLLAIGRQLDDYRAAIAFARTLPDVDPERIALWGTSFSGGHVLTLGAQRDDVAAIVAQIPFTDGLPAVLAAPPLHAARGFLLAVGDRALAVAGRGPVTIPAVGPPGSFAFMTAADAEPGIAAMLHPHSRWRNAVAARLMFSIGRYRPGRGAARIACPLLVVVGDGDETTPPGPAMTVAQRAPRGELLRTPYGHFDVYGGDAWEQVVAGEAAFLARHLLR